MALDGVAAMLLVAAAGAVAGAINTVSGGGTYITLPLLAFLGLEPHVANATNRFAIAFQALAAVRTLRGHGIVSWRECVPPAFVALLGAIPGAHLAKELDPRRYESAIGWILLVGIALLFVRPMPEAAARAAGGGGGARRALALCAAFLLGIYGGFLGAGIGVMIVLVLTPLLRLELVRMTAVKVSMLLALSISATGFNLIHSLVDWRLGLPLLAGNLVGGLYGARLTLRIGESRLRAAVAATAAVMAVVLICGW